MLEEGTPFWVVFEAEMRVLAFEVEMVYKIRGRPTGIFDGRATNLHCVKTFRLVDFTDTTSQNRCFWDQVEAFTWLIARLRPKLERAEAAVAEYKRGIERLEVLQTLAEEIRDGQSTLF